MEYFLINLIFVCVLKYTPIKENIIYLDIANLKTG